MHPASAGDACSTDCAVLVCFRWATTLDERRYEAWEWRKRTAEARGLPFDERPPPDVVDRWLSTWLAAKPALKSYLERKAA